MNGTSAAVDPGWRRAIGRVPSALLSLFVPRRPGQAGGGVPPIVPVRAAFVAYVGMLAVFLAVLVLVLPPTAADTPNTAALILAAGVLPLAMIPWSRRRLAGVCGPPRDLAEAYATGFHVGVALADSAALLGFVASFVAGGWWPYPVGMALAAVGFAGVAPTESRIRSLDEALARAGCPHSLRQGLYAPALPGPPTDR